jgi:hypothetical protein
LPINIGSQKGLPKTFLPSSRLQLFEIKEILFFQKNWKRLASYLLNKLYLLSPPGERGMNISIPEENYG